MRPGETPKHTLNIKNFNMTLIDKVRVTYDQFGKVILQKEKPDVHIENGKLWVKLTQEESLRFKDGQPFKIQWSITTTGGECFRTPPFTVPCEETIDKEAL